MFVNPIHRNRSFGIFFLWDTLCLCFTPLTKWPLAMLLFYDYFGWGLMSYYSKIAIISCITTRKLLKVICPKDMMTAFPHQHASIYRVKLIQIIYMSRGVLPLTFRYELQPVLPYRETINRKSNSGVLGRYILLPKGWFREWRYSTREMVVTLTLYDSNHTGMHIKRKTSSCPVWFLSMHNASYSLQSHTVLICHPAPVSSPVWGKTPWVIPLLHFRIPLNWFLHSTLCFAIFFTVLPPLFLQAPKLLELPLSPPFT